MGGANFGYSYLCTCGTWIGTENGLDYEVQLEFLEKMVNAHRLDHMMRIKDQEPI